MAIKQAKAALADFLTRNEAGAVALTGAWGSGKTYLWSNVIGELAERQAPPFTRYAYVSLFGINSLADLKAALFENAVPPDKVRSGATAQTWRDELETLLDPKTVGIGLKSSMKRAFWQLRRSFGNVSGFLPSWGAALRSASFLAIRDYVVCIDDIERRGANLSMVEVLGLISLLKEQRNCRVVLILNEDQLKDGQDAGRETYNGFREKVLDWEIVLEPTPEECAALVFDGNKKIQSFAAIHAESLGITNIRILQRVRKALDTFGPLLATATITVIESFAHAATVLTWCYYGGGVGAPKYGFVRDLTLGQFVALGRNNNKASDEEKAWMATLSNYGYRSLHTLDSQLFHYLEHGYVEEEASSAALAEANVQAQAQLASGSMSTAWEMLHNSFADNTDEFVHTLLETANASSPWLNYFEAESVSFVLRRFGTHGEADRFTMAWVEASLAVNPKRLARPRQIFASDTDDAFRALVESKRPVDTRVRTLGDTIRQLAGMHGWQAADLDVLTAATVDDFEAFFRSAGPDTDLVGYVKVCLDFGTSEGQPAAQQNIAATASEALRRIAADSPLNAYRVSKFELVEPGPDKPAFVLPNPFVPPGPSD